mmetsp:Transcript_18013/g.23716  ORF Transcript_18013/g.23716 Transcript_18013/m.23716 type:complete len:365 (+) Transcript_18013:62-1156(+)|eukprot:CAMPEP_0117768874 /NCGR_PEP_ID=MMETSP0947-20121206/22650_1 /TAXON_ID=44440 /ORGANISM="Chattonella subsalsa, Strain CCMP2191" /LENGTH=364 /DNA_ID=CAMNT_0005593169 /DNA_START=64 /DNA_END=1158 /DNA_ORIENTATION=-
MSVTQKKILRVTASACTMSVPPPLAVLENSFKFLEGKEILTSLALVNRQWQEASLSPSIWQQLSIRKWSRWRNSSFGKFEFCFQTGVTENEILSKEKELEIRLRHDIREILKECSCVRFPSTLLMEGEYPTLPTHLERVADWECFDETCCEKFGVSPSIFTDYNQIFHPSHKYIVIGSSTVHLIVLNVMKSNVVAVSLNLSGTVRNEGPFDEWFDRGAALLEVTANDLQGFEKVSERTRAAVVCCICQELTLKDESFPSSRNDGRDYSVEFIMRFLETIFCDTSLLCRFYIEEMKYMDDDDDDDAISIIESALEDVHNAEMIDILLALMDDLLQKGFHLQQEILSDYIVFPTSPVAAQGQSVAL